MGIKAWRSGLEGLKRRRQERQELEIWAKTHGKKVLLLNAAIISRDLRLISYVLLLQILLFFLHHYHSESQSVLKIIERITQNHTGSFSKSERGNCLYISLGTRFIGTQTGVWQTQGNMRVVSSD